MTDPNQLNANTPDPIEELAALLFDWEAGLLDDVGITRVREILRADAAARAFFVEQQVFNAALKLDVDAGLTPAPSATESDNLQISPPSSLQNDSLQNDSQHEEPRQDRDASAQVALPAPITDQTRQLNRWVATIAILLICGLSGRVVYLDFFALKSAGNTVVTGGNAAGSAAGNTNDNNLSGNGQRNESQEATSSGVALVTRLVDIRWSAEQATLEVGDALPPGPLAIDSGYAQVEFFCGATVVIEGPAKLDLKSTMLARVHHGKLRAHVPPAARGFLLQVDDMKVIDLGTEFGLAVSPAGANVQVFDGEVELQSPRQAKRLLTAGQAIKRTGQGEFQNTAATPERFLDIASLAARADGQQTARYQKWKAWSDRLQADPRLIAYYSFAQQGAWERKLQNAATASDGELAGAIVGARRVPGRWPNKSGLEFKRPGDRVRVQIPGEYSSLTFACWVKIDSLDRWYNSLFLTDGYNQGEPHWQILDTGQLFFSVRHRPDKFVKGQQPQIPPHQTVLSPPFWKPSLSGRWLHLATTYNVQAARTTHYLNGVVLHEEVVDSKLLVNTTRIGAASIGNWSIPTRPDEEFAIRNLNGSIDEFAIFSAALSADEIKEMYEHGKP